MINLNRKTLCHLISLLTAAGLLLALLPACGANPEAGPEASGAMAAMAPSQSTEASPSPTVSEEPDSFEGTLTQETTRIGSERLALDLGDFPLNEDAACTIEPVENPAPIEGAEVKAYSFKIDTDEALFSVMELTIPYDAEALGGQSAEGSVAAAYYNEETGQWEPVAFAVNEDSGTVTIYTDHLSVYGCFEVTNPNTKKAYAAYAIPAFAKLSLTADAADAVVTAAVQNGGNPGAGAIDAGLAVMDTVLNLGSAGADTAVYLGGLANAGTGAPSLLKGISERLGQLGLLCSIAQVASGMYSIYQGNKNAIFPCYANALKGSLAYSAGKMGARLFSLAFLGVLAVEYSVNTFAQEALSGRKDIYQKAYSLYYESKGVRRTARDWAQVFIKAKEGAASAERYQLRIEGLVQKYVDQFWQDELVIAEYQDQAMTYGFTGGGGLNETIKTEISNDYKLTLYKGVLQDAFKLIAQKEAMDAEKALLKELDAVRAELNKKCTLTLFDSTVNDKKPKSDLAGAKVQVTLPDTVTDADGWSVVLDDKGGGKIEFTTLAYLMAEGPTELAVYLPGTDEGEEPDKTVTFAMATTNTKVDISVEALPLAELLGTYTGTMTLSSVYVSDAIMRRAEEAPLEFDDENLEMTGDCDAAMLVAMKQMEGQILSATMTITAPEGSTSACTINMTASEDGESDEGSESQPMSAAYSNGKFTLTGGSMSLQGFKVTLDLSAEKTGERSCHLTGLYIAAMEQYPDDLKITADIAVSKGG